MKKVLLTGALALSAFSTSAANAGTEFEFWHSQSGGAAEQLCEAFNEQSEHTVKCIYQGEYEAAMQKAVASVRSGRHPVLMQFYDVGTMDIMMSGMALPVQEMMSEVDWTTYLNGARGYYQSAEGQMQSQPWNSSTLVLYSNKKALQDAGIEKAPETYEELVQAMETLKESGHNCPYTTDGHPWRVLEQVSSRHGVEIASENNGYNGLNAEYTFNSGLLAGHLQNLKEWNQQGLVKLSPQTRAGHYLNAFASGECAMTEASLSGFASSLSALGDDLQLSIAPVYEDHKRYNTFVGGGSIWMLQGHDEEKHAAAREFLDFLRQPEQQKLLSLATGYLPVTTEGYEKIAASEIASEPEFMSIQVGYDSLNMPASDVRGIRLGFYTQFRSIFQEETQKAFAGDIPMQEALDNAKRRGDSLLRRFERTYRNS